MPIPNAIRQSNPLDWVERQDHRMDELNDLIACGLGDLTFGDPPAIRLSYRANWDAFNVDAAMARITKRPRRHFPRVGHAHT